MPFKILAPAVIAASVSWIAGSAAAAPVSPSLALKNADAVSVAAVQWRRGHHGRWIGPAAGFAAGVVIGSALAPRYGYDGDGAYASDPGSAYVPARRYFGGNCGSYRGCTGDENVDSAYPSWMCR